MLLWFPTAQPNTAQLSPSRLQNLSVRAYHNITCIHKNNTSIYAELNELVLVLWKSIRNVVENSGMLQII